MGNTVNCLNPLNSASFNFSADSVLLFSKLQSKTITWDNVANHCLPQWIFRLVKYWKYVKGKGEIVEKEPQSDFFSLQKQAGSSAFSTKRSRLIINALIFNLVFKSISR